jgi:hypothetical protein
LCLSCRRFGFANSEALAAGETGTNCRGEEHDITLVWSITSGKRLILADGQEVHYSASRTGILDFSWTMRGNHVLKIVAHASPPLSTTPGFRQYDFFVDGLSFFSFPKVFRLGLSAGDPRGNPTPHSYNNYPHSTPTAMITGSRTTGIAAIETPHNPDEEEAYLQEAIKNSLEEVKSGKPGSAPSVSQAGRDLLLDFLDDTSTLNAAPAPLAIANQPFVATDYGQAYAAPSPTTFAPPPSYNDSAAYAYNNFNSSAPTYNNYSLPPAPAPYTNYALPPASQVPSFDAAPSYPPQSANSFPVSAAPPPASDPWGPASNTSAAPQWNTGYTPSIPVTPSGFPPNSDAWTSQPSPATANYSYGTPQVPTPAVSVEFQNPPPQPTPSSVGFSSPQSNGDANLGFAYQSQDINQHPPNTFQNTVNPDTFPDFVTHPTATPSNPNVDFAFGAAQQNSLSLDPVLFSMNVLSEQSNQAPPAQATQNLSLADQAYMKYANMGEFELVSKKEPVSENPFAYAPVGSTLSLADMKARVSKAEAKKPIMKSPMAAAPPQAGSSNFANGVTPNPNALVLHNTQSGNNWAQHVQQPVGQQTFGNIAYGQAPSPYWQQPVAGQTSYSQAQPMQYQQPPQPQTDFSAPPYTQPSNMQQNPFGGPPAGQFQF